MAGLLSQMPTAGAPQPPMGEPPARMQRGPTDPMNMEGEEANVSPEEQATYDAFVGNAYKLIEKARDGILSSLGASEDPKMNLANATAQVVMAVHQSAAKSGQQISPDVLFHGGAEIMETLAEAAERAQIHNFTEEELEGAFFQAVDMYREMATQAGLVDPEHAKAEFQNVLQQDQSGELAAMFREFVQDDGAA